MTFILDEKLKAYAEQRKLAMAKLKPVSHEKAMAQILKYSPCRRENVYASGLINDDRALVLMRERTMSKKMYYAEQGGIDVVFITTAETPTQVIEEAKEFIEKEKRLNKREPPVVFHEVLAPSEIPEMWQNTIPWGDDSASLKDLTCKTILEKKDIYLDGVVYLDGIKFVKVEE